MDTMSYRLSAAALTVALMAGVVLADKAATSAVKSGPQAGEELAGPFHPLNVTGKKAGEKHCLYCENGNAPVVMIFAREPGKVLGKLLKKVDAACQKNTGCKMASFVVFCTKDTDGKLEAKLKDCAKENGLKKVVLAIDNPAGPEGYKVAKEADITVVLYVDRTVKANRAYKKGEMKEKDVDAIIADLSKILPAS
jgi:hypothetical protein